MAYIRLWFANWQPLVISSRSDKHHRFDDSGKYTLRAVRAENFLTNTAPPLKMELCKPFSNSNKTLLGAY